MFRRLVDRATLAFLSPRKLQERADVLNLYMLLRHYTGAEPLAAAGSSEAQQQAQRAFAVPFADQQRFVEEEVTRQMRVYFDVARCGLVCLVAGTRAVAHRVGCACGWI